MEKKLLKPVLLSNNLTLNSDAAPNYKHLFYLICEISQGNLYYDKYYDDMDKVSSVVRRYRLQEEAK